MEFGLLSYNACAVAYFVLSLLFLTSWRGKVQGVLLLYATAITAIWGGILALQANLHVFSSTLIWSMEIIRTTIWLIFLYRLLSGVLRSQEHGLHYLRHINYFIYALCGVLLFFVWVFPYLSRSFPALFQPNFQILGHIVMAVCGMVLVEYLYLNTRPDLRWNIKFLCLALGGMFAYDFYLYSDALLFSRLDAEIWVARGAVLAVVAPLFGIAAARNPGWSIDIFVSRGMIFHSLTLVCAGLYLLIMAFGGYYIKLFGGEWGRVAQIVFSASAFIAFLLLFFSGRTRARFRVFLNKHFFSYSYDYREEWLRIITTLSEEGDNTTLEQRVIVALADLVESPGGVLWVRDANGQFSHRASYNRSESELGPISEQDGLIKFIEQSSWVINLDEMEQSPELYSGVTKSAWLSRFKNAWVLVPLFQGDTLYGIVLLNSSRTKIDWNWEVIDLLGTAGKQAASYLAFEDAASQLAEARQFEGFNRLSAFVIHDLKNLIAQLTLVVGNAERHKNNPEFMQDAIKTVEHAVGKMNRLMSQLKNANVATTKINVDLTELLAGEIKGRSNQSPTPVLEHPDAELGIWVSVHPDRLASAFEHVIQNAQDAAGKNGKVAVRIYTRENQAIVEVEDNGVGMDREFIRNRLFKPFDTTKGLTGMGIGAYESREYIRSLGGDLSVRSKPKEGSLFSFVIPLHMRVADQKPIVNMKGAVG